jgi:hypothetical protein
MKIAHHFLPVTLAIASSMALSTQAMAGDLNNVTALSQTDFLALSKDLAAATSTKAIEPAAPLGLTSDESFTQSKSFVGVSWNVLLVNLSAEYDRTGKNASVGLKAGVRF